MPLLCGESRLTTRKPACALTHFGPRTLTVDAGALSFLDDLRAIHPDVGPK